jgi:hypothetical protein
MDLGHSFWQIHEDPSIQFYLTGTWDRFLYWALLWHGQRIASSNIPMPPSGSLSGIITGVNTLSTQDMAAVYVCINALPIFVTHTRLNM